MLNHLINAVMSGIFVIGSKISHSVNSNIAAEKRAIKKSGTKGPILFDELTGAEYINVYQQRIKEDMEVLEKCVLATGGEYASRRTWGLNAKFIRNNEQTKEETQLGVYYHEPANSKAYYYLNFGYLQTTIDATNCMQGYIQDQLLGQLEERLKKVRELYHVPPRHFYDSKYYISGDPDYMRIICWDEVEVNYLPYKRRSEEEKEWFDAVAFRIKYIADIIVALCRTVIAIKYYRRPPDDIAPHMGGMPWVEYADLYREEVSKRDKWF